MNVVFAAAEAVPFCKTGGLADVMGALPKALVKEGCQVSVFLPFYKEVEESGFDFERIDDHFLKAIHDGVQFYFIDHDHFFDRDGLYGDSDGDYEDNFDRFHYFCEQILENLIDPDNPVDIIHCHDWHAALIPVLLKAKYDQESCFKNTKTILTIHNLAFQGVFPKERFAKLNIADEFFTEETLRFYDQVCFLKGGICLSDQVTTVSEQYAREIKTKAFGCGLEKEIQGLKRDIVGIVNGIDKDVWNPQTDTLIFENFTEATFKEHKALNKKHLQEQFKLAPNADKIVLGFVGRVSQQKGIDVILEAFDALRQLPIQCIIQGVGCVDLQNQLMEVANRYCEQFVYFDGFDESIAHRIYAGSDFFLMPSEFEPCGLSQMIAMRYGTLPIVAPTGGLVDTVDHDKNGFVMKEISADALVETVKEAVSVFESTEKFSKMRTQALKTNFGWEDSARKYKELYACL